MGKIVDGVELLRMVRDGEIKENETKIIDKSRGKEYIFDGDNIRDEKYFNLLDQHSDCDFIRKKFEILSEEDEEIDIEAIEEFDRPNINLHDLKDVEKEIKWLQDAHNELIKAVKQLYRMTKEEK